MEPGIGFSSWALGRSAVTPGAPQPVRVLLVTSSEDDRIQLAQIAESAHLKMHQSDTCREAAEYLKESTPSVIVTDCGLLDGDWSTVRGLIASRNPAPKLVVVASRCEGQLRAAARDHGIHGLLFRPFEESTVVRLLTSAIEGGIPN